MKAIFDFVRANGHLIAACIAGTCALTAAYIRRDRRWERNESRVPILGLLFPPVFAMIVGVGCLAIENFVYPIEPGGVSEPGDPGPMFAWFGSVMIAAGLIWLPYNIYRMAKWPRPQPVDDDAEEMMEDEIPPSMPVASTSVTTKSSGGRPTNVKPGSTPSRPGSTPNRPGGSSRPGSTPNRPGSTPGRPGSTPNRPNNPGSSRNKPQS